MSTKVVNKRKTKEYDVDISRSGKYGNPFIIGKDGNRADVISKHEKWLMDSKQKELRKDIIKNLKGKVLACYCKPLACHGDTLKKLIDGKIKLKKKSIDNYFT
jgi:hypothetical protein